MNDVVLLLGNGNGMFQPPVQTSSNGAQLAVDLNGDGNLDLVSQIQTDSLENAVSVALGNGDGTFQPSRVYVASSGDLYGDPYVADFNGDGKLDIAMNSGGLVFFFLGDGLGNFSTQTPPLILGTRGFQNFGDFFDHGLPDVQTTFGAGSHTILILKNQTPE